MNDGVGWKFGAYTIRHLTFRINKYRFPSFSNPLLVVAAQSGDSLHEQSDDLVLKQAMLLILSYIKYP